MGNNSATIFKDDIVNDSDKIVETIFDLSELLLNTKKNIIEIQEMNFISRIIKVDVNAISNILIDQNDAIATFLNVVQGLVFVNMSNIVVMDEVLEKLSTYRKENSYVEVAKSYIQSAITMSNQSNDMLDNYKKDLDELKYSLIEKSHLDESQNLKIKELADNSKMKEQLDEIQDNKINDIFKLIEDKKDVDHAQNQKINMLIELLRIKKDVDIQQTKELNLLKELISIQNDKISYLEKKFEKSFK